MNPILSYEVEQRLRAALAAAALSDEMGAPERVEKALLAELRRRKRRAMATQIAAAGALAAAVLVGLFLTRPTPPVAAPPVVINAVPAPIPPAAPAAVAKAAVKRRSAPKTVAPAMATTAFMAVGPWQAMEPMERGSIIRVRLPKSSLPGFGIPVSADRWNESIPADVLLGEDGSMRAVRFVNTRQ